MGTNITPEQIESYLTAINNKTAMERYREYLNSIEPKTIEDIMLINKTANALWLAKYLEG
jgi:hypothetical protein